MVEYRPQFLRSSLVCAVLVMLFSFPTVGFSAEAQVHTVTIHDLEFDPPTLTVRVGDTVKWVNQDFIPHTATANDKTWDSQLIDVEKSWELVVTESTLGNYYCLYHPGMKGSWVIQP